MESFLSSSSEVQVLKKEGLFRLVGKVFSVIVGNRATNRIMVLIAKQNLGMNHLNCNLIGRKEGAEPFRSEKPITVDLGQG
ncbi:unnamed protein product [Hermetia illucens]|uniref:Uncharacterized protein n=1 Tax=Hermetia illucens TaxID=343691 RepID=A0A7R8UG35_HERIL|nr:unnamed protein product [Hermetia illucens]